jgi:divalent metal cation (Fe/Co/Zn/Cd) transporter
LRVRDVTTDQAREALLRRAAGLEYLTVGWNVVEGIVAVSAAVASGSVALLGFGLDSFVESTSGLILLWRLARERRSTGISPEAIERLDRLAHRLVGGTLFLLAAYVSVDAGLALWNAERPETSVVGLIVVSVSIAVMWWLARAKAAAARGLGSRALEADAFQTMACWWLSIVTLAGIGLNAALGWWWADPLAALGVAALIVREGVEAWRGETCC